MANTTTPSNDEKSGVPLTIETKNILEPPKAALFDTPTPSATTPEKVIELRRDSAPSSPNSCRNDNPFDTDVEAMITATSTNDAYASRTKPSVMKPDCPSVWPSAEQWKQKAKVTKKARHTCNCMANLSKRNRIIVKVLIALLIVGIGLGVGFGISRATNAPIWGDRNNDDK